MEALKPCPICGGEPEFQHFNITPNVRGRIICSCGLEIMQGANDTEDDLRNIWNTREGVKQSAEWAELQSRLIEAERRAAIYEHIAEDQKARNRDMRNTVNAVTGADADSRWQQLFGTPERAAEYFAMQCFGSDGSLCYYCTFDDCDEKLRNSGAYPHVYDTLIEWLRGDA